MRGAKRSSARWPTYETSASKSQRECRGAYYTEGGVAGVPFRTGGIAPDGIDQLGAPGLRGIGGAVSIVSERV